MAQNMLAVICIFFAAFPASAEQILATDIVEIGCYQGNDETCSATEGMRVRFDLCCPCFRWSYMGDVSSTKQSEYTLRDDYFGWLSHITSVDCVVGSKGTAVKGADQVCLKQPEGKAYRCKIQSITHRQETCDQVTPVCEQGAFPGDEYEPLGGKYVPLPGATSISPAGATSTSSPPPGAAPASQDTTSQENDSVGRPFAAPLLLLLMAAIYVRLGYEANI